MRTSSCKAKGRRCALEAKELLLKHSSLADEDLVVTPSGVPGRDIHLSPLALKTFPFAIECKNQEAISIWNALSQAKTHAKGEQIPLLIFKRNHSEMYCALPFEQFLMLINRKRRKSNGKEIKEKNHQES